MTDAESLALIALAFVAGMIVGGALMFSLSRHDH